jgi:hypothetical protein
MLSQIPYAIATPVMILNSAIDKSGRTVVLVTSLKDYQGKSVLVPIIVNQVNFYHEVNAIKSIYGKDNDQWFQQEIKAGRLRYIDKEMALPWSRSARLQLPLDVTTQGLSLGFSTVPKRGECRLLTEKNIVKPVYENEQEPRFLKNAATPSP